MCKKITLCLHILTLASIISALVVNDANETVVIKESPLIIDTVLNHYDNPTIDEYYRCVKSRDSCVQKCKFRDEDCKNNCPTCPVLYNHDIIVQGINDTEYRSPSSTGTTNQTNIIRVINEIRNIIDTKLGNISANSQNLFNVYQNTSSKTGGKYGLGYNEQGPCCHLIEPKRCKRSIKGFNCAPRHQLSCGSHCISRVMRTRRLVSCNDMNPSNCTSVREYIPERRRPGCQYISKYPFIECAVNQIPKATNCNHCFMIPYINVVRGRVPRHCFHCYSHSSFRHKTPYYSPPNLYHNPAGYQPPYIMYNLPPVYETPDYDHSFDDDWQTAENDFNEPSFPSIQDETREKCNDSSAEGCQDANKNGDKMEHNDLDNDQNEETGDDYYDDNSSD